MNQTSAREQDKQREEALKKSDKKREKKRKRLIKTTTIQTMPYECFVSNYVMLLKSNVRIGKETANLYSKTYLVPDVNYSALTKAEQLEKMQAYVDLLNGFDNSVSLQVTLLNTKINREHFRDTILLKMQGDGLDGERKEFNDILQEKIMHGQNGIHCRKYITVTVAAINIDAANTRFFNMETHLTACLNRLGTDLIPLDANDRVRLMADILRDVDTPILPVSREEFARKAEKMLCCPDYFEFKKDYFMYNDKYARCLYFKKLPQSVQDTLFKDLIEVNQSLIISKNVEFVEPSEGSIPNYV